MNDERLVDVIVTKFLLNTCLLRPQLSKFATQAIMNCGYAQATALDPGNDEVIPLTTGSVAEFYVEPMLLHVGDVDVMGHYSTRLAIPHGHPPPTQLPDEFHNNYVGVSEITDSHLPGYVYLQPRYLLTECVDDGKYNATDYQRQTYLVITRPRDVSDSVEIHGPAVTTIERGPLLSLDAVPCIRCLVWPPQAAEWPTRHRNYGWPDSATVDRVVSNGCDVVRVAHRQCRQHE